MDPFKQFVGSEGCSSSESGWTTYIVSPMDEDGSDNDEHGEADNNGYYAHGGYCSGNYRDIIVGGGGEADSDDSMASDASSGACHHQSNGQKAASFKHGGKVKKNISSSFSQFLSGIKPSSSKDKKKEEKGLRPDRKLPATGSRKCRK
ncbi:unnamed protein product [Linum trigynum]|uniref:Uncharacterized protein n=1 Tax=Linum trigynum TaxID=586398 RepID=A0AAV2EXT1_9ROSI